MARSEPGAARGVAVLVIPVLPVSFNQTRYAPWYVTRSKNKPFVDALTLVLNTSRLPRPRAGEHLASVEASAVLRFKDRRRRDEGNYRTTIEKALGDALTGRGYLEDDTPDQYRFTTCEFDPERGTPQTTLTLKWKEAK